MEIRLLGPVQAVVAGRPVNLGVRKQRLVLAVLALEVNRPLTVARLVDLVWPQDPPAAARGMIHNYISGLRSVLTRTGAHRDGIRLDREESGYVLHCDPSCIDVHSFRALVADARSADEDERRVAVLGEALALWRGPALAGAADEEVRDRLCRGLEEARLAAVEELFDAQLRLGRHESLLDELLVVVSEHPHRPRLAAALMRALHRAGRTAEALQAYQDLRQRLGDELGLDPPAELQALHVAILRQQPDLSEMPGDMAGNIERRPDPAQPRPAQLPAAPSSFTGRQAALDHLLALRPNDDQPLATVVISAIEGMPGVGKTALAVHAAHRLASRFPDGQIFVDLHGFTQGIAPVEPADALERMLRTLGVQADRLPRHLDDRAALYRSLLVGKRMLILLDNAATEAQILPLLPGVPGCLVLVTSRVRLAGLDHAQPLSLDVLSPGEALTLFMSIVGEQRLAGQSPELLAEIVELCGGLPLAIRIAAARLRARPIWTVADLADRLRDRRHRLSELKVGQHNVTAAIDMSYQHLDSDRRRLFRLLGLHPGPDIDTHAAAALINTTLRRAAQLLYDLVDAHLLQEPVPGRYRFHDLLRAHAADLAAAEETEVDRHAALARLLDHYTHTAAAATATVYPSEPGPRLRIQQPTTPMPVLDDEPQATAWLEAELPNLLTVGSYAAGHGMPAHAQQLSATLHRHLRTRGLFTHAHTLHSQALSTARATGHRDSELYSLLNLGYVHWVQSRYDEAADNYEQALKIARDIGDRGGELVAIWGLGHVAVAENRYKEAADSYGNALKIARDIGDDDGEVPTLTGLGHVNVMQRQYGQAADHFEQAFKIASATDNRVGQTFTLTGLGHVHLLERRYGQAADHFEQALEIAVAIGDRSGEVYARTGLGHVHRAQGRHDQAISCYENALEIARVIGFRAGELRALWALGHVYRQQNQHRNAAECYENAVNIARQFGFLKDQFEALYGLGRTQMAGGDASRSLTHLQAALDNARELGHPNDQVRAHRALAQAYEILGRHLQARRHQRQAQNILADLNHTKAGTSGTTSASN